ncbi:DUF2147 domain-containing protein [Parasphingopyxis marina]|uniref:DUF2147 domain-containing protein n=1 Tax=Parasphingopyxis marina TaxID=2761622 RepID=A0A842HZC8_9SPHN|nr:DUF2147 domain-containing protein [Parasphingopyxis marina]MBC2776844.1 DUF2147 domain-containing protein [Parasphingopyxis marina]
MRIATIVLGIAALAAAAPAFAQSSITGRWLTEDRRAIIRIAPCGGAICGYIQQVLREMPDADQRDENNPDPALRSRRIIGMPVLTGFRLDGNRWRHGEIYDPEDGRNYSARMELNANGSLSVTGCVLGGIICQSEVWTRRR